MKSLEEIAKEMVAMGTSPETIDREIHELSKSIKSEVWKMTKEKMTMQQARLKKGMSLEDVAEETGYSVKRVEWHENNAGDMTVDESMKFCELYGVKFDDITFKEDTKEEEKELIDLYPTARRMTFLSNLKSKVSDVILSVTNDQFYTDRSLMKDLIEIVDELRFEDEALSNELSQQFEMKNRLNSTLAGR